MGKLCSIIIRTRNEDRWIASCLASVYRQTYQNFEVILVDNESSDRTLEKARKFPIAEILTCKEYLPGKALNLGIRASKGDYIVCLSGHCIPVNEQWLANLVRNLDDSCVAAAYGRQEPLPFSSDADKRDLMLVFGLDRRIQIKDSFFHNANSIMKRELWKKIPFDEKATNIEDRIWAYQMIQNGYKIIYDPEASVYHYHGIHQNGDIERCANVVRILEGLDENQEKDVGNIEDLEIVAIIPVKGPTRDLSGQPVIAYTIENALASRYVKHVFVSTDDKSLAQLAVKFGAKAPFLRPPLLSSDYMSWEPIFTYSLAKMEDEGIFPDIVVMLGVTFPFRPDGLIDDMIRHTVQKGLDTTIAARKESHSLWQETPNGSVKCLDDAFVPRKYKDNAFVGFEALCCVTRAEFLYKEKLLGNKIGLFEVDNPYSFIEVREDRDFWFAEYIMKVWTNEESLRLNYGHTERTLR